MEEHARLVRDKLVEDFKAELDYKNDFPIFEHVTEPHLIHHPDMERVRHD